VTYRILGPILLIATLVLAGCGNERDNQTAVDPPPVEESTSSSAESPPTEESPSPGSDGTCTYTPDGTTPVKPVTPPPAEPSATRKVSAVISTSAGKVDVVLQGKNTPCTVNSFLSLAEQGYFDKTQCHRLTTDGIYVLQCGDPTASGSGGPGYAFADELTGTETYPAGTLAMANAGPGTNGSQFFLVYKDTRLDPNYTVFGKMDAASIRVVQKIAAQGTADGAPDGAPKEPIEIQSVRRR
jgi:peptidyl-prolyl cis-trans isomerase B (cyclophilin B)